MSDTPCIHLFIVASESDSIDSPCNSFLGDDLRAITSKKTLDRIMVDRESMIKSRAIVSEKEQQLRSRNEAHCMSLINKDESDGQSQRRQSSLEIKRTLDHQVQWKRTKASAMASQLQREEQEELRHLALLEQKARESAKGSKEKANKDGEELLNATRLRAKKSELRREEERKQNLLLLQHAGSLGLKKIQADLARKQVDKDASSEYANFLRKEALMEEEQGKALNRIRDAESSRITQLNDDKCMAESEMKRRWMEEVSAARHNLPALTQPRIPYHLFP